MKRLFIAIDLSINQEVNSIHSKIKFLLKHENINWVKPENMHITLKFLGSTPSEHIVEINKIVTDACQNLAPIQLEFEKIGLFGSSYAPRVIWLGFAENEILSQFAETLKKNLVRLGFEYDRQNFVPHLTLGRIQKIETKSYFQSVLNNYKTLSLSPVKVENIYLFESILRKNGPEYISLKSWDLK